MTARYYPLEALVAASGLSEAALARSVQMSGTTLKNARERGLRMDAADRYAVRAGFHPSEVWDDWFPTEGVDGVPYWPVKAKQKVSVTRDRAENKDNAHLPRGVTIAGAVRAVERRLQDEPMALELHQLRGLSLAERAILADREAQDPQARDGGVAA